MTNLLLQLLSDADQKLLDLTPIEVPARARLEEANVAIPYIYFFTSGMASIVFKGRGDFQSEIAVIGNEGCSGCAVILGFDRTPQATTMQVQGEAQRCSTEAVTRALEISPSLRRVLQSQVHLAIIQRDETALSASRGNVSQRLARWLLMAQDRLHSDDLDLTHDLISIMLGVRRAGVSGAMGDLGRTELISQERGSIKILDRIGLIALAGPFYGAQKAEADRIHPQLAFRTVTAH